MANNDMTEGERRFMQSVEDALHLAAGLEGPTELQLHSMCREIIGGLVDKMPDLRKSPFAWSIIDNLQALIWARTIVDKLAAEQFGDHRPMADTRLDAIVKVAGNIVNRWEYLERMAAAARRTAEPTTPGSR